MRDNEITSSIASGGHYNEIIGTLLGVEERYPCVGFSLGLDSLFFVLQKEEVPLSSLPGFSLIW
ncbi:hypothetical protein ACFFGV_11675 [Pontibacillus salicampi]|uniref:Class II Histidinyl-tRNA synthetase (HisRS)-like catalytic core domain-containing protein n=1 Tax=Pontibacillus salicampi TaxID=1449801 RepID=A0ABV6LPH2_9BACI